MSAKPAAFLLIKPAVSAIQLAADLKAGGQVRWSAAAFGPYPVVAYIEGEAETELVRAIEQIRVTPAVAELDARVCKPVPGDESLPDFSMPADPLSAMLLINVDYRVEKERVVTYRLRELSKVRWARAMWGPADIVALVSADDSEAMRDFICDEVKILQGVAGNTTLFCYPPGA